jgi:hypothetical protein
MHVIIVAEHLSYFAHIHPEIKTSMIILDLLYHKHFQNLVNTNYGLTSNQKMETKLLQHLN